MGKTEICSLKKYLVWMRISRKNKYYYTIVYFNFSMSSRWCWRSKILWKTDCLLTIQPVLYRCKQAQEILILNMSFSCQMRISEWSHSQEILILHQSFLSLLMAILRADWLEDNQFPRGSWTFNITYWTRRIEINKKYSYLGRIDRERLLNTG